MSVVALVTVLLFC